MSNVSSVVNHFPTAHEGFVTTLGSSILSGATTVPLTTVSGLTNGNIFVGIIEPSLTKEQTFTGVIDTGGSQITGVKWTRGTNADHSAGVTVVDYVTGTALNMITKGILVSHDQDGLIKLNAALTTNAATLTSPKVITSINDTNNNELLKVTATDSAVNELTVTNAATGNAPSLAATGSDTNIPFKMIGKGTGLSQGTSYRQDNTTNSVKPGTVVTIYGWGYVAGTDGAFLDKSITLPVTFADEPVVVVTAAGSSATSGTTYPPTAAAGTSIVILKAITTSSFDIRYVKFAVSGVDAGTTFVSGTNYFYTWEATGELT